MSFCIFNSVYMPRPACCGGFFGFAPMPVMPQVSIFGGLFTPGFNFFGVMPFIARPVVPNFFNNSTQFAVPQPNFNTTRVDLSKIPATVPSVKSSNPFSFLDVKTNKVVEADNKKSTRKSAAKVDTDKNEALPSLQKAGYNKRKGKKLANEIAAVSSQGGFDNYCAKHVKQAIEDAGLGSYESGHAYQMSSILADNKNFKEISTKGLDLDKLPAGCVLVYDKGVAGYNSQYGHTEITLGNGTAGSGGITNNIRDGARVFIPV